LYLTLPIEYLHCPDLALINQIIWALAFEHLLLFGLEGSSLCHHS